MFQADTLYVETCPSSQTPPALVLTSGRSDSAGLLSWEQRSGDFGRSPHPRCSFPHFQTRWGGQNNVRDCGRRGRCPGLSCCSGSLGNAEERRKSTELMKKILPAPSCTLPSGRLVNIVGNVKWMNLTASAKSGLNFSMLLSSSCSAAGFRALFSSFFRRYACRERFSKTVSALKCYNSTSGSDAGCGRFIFPIFV